jgi:hypothetical protein
MDGSANFLTPNPKSIITPYFCDLVQAETLAKMQTAS